MDIAIAGGTGVVGSVTARVAQERGHTVRILARSVGVDVRTGAGLEAAIAGADAVVEAVSTHSQSQKVATAFFHDVTATLLQAEQRAGIGHHVALSIVNVDRAPHGYYGAKYEQEQLIELGAVPWSILRATQFHNFAAQVFQQASFGPIHPLVRMRTQPVDPREVAERLVDLAEAGPSGRAQDIAGPREESLVDMMRAWAAHTGKRGWMPRLSLPGGFGRAMREGTMLPGPDAQRGTVTFSEWLAAQPRG